MRGSAGRSGRRGCGWPPSGSRPSCRSISMTCRRSRRRSSALPARSSAASSAASRRHLVPAADRRGGVLRHRRHRDRHAADRARAWMHRARGAIAVGIDRASSAASSTRGSSGRAAARGSSDSARTTTCRSIRCIRSSALGAVEPSKLDALARLLTYVLPAPVMLLATNRESTGVGVRPRGDRIEVTADFTPDPTMMVAAGSLITGIIREMATWPSFELATLAAPRTAAHARFAPMPHTSRKGWLARFDCYPCESVHVRCRTTLRPIATQIFSYFRRPIARVADPFSLRLIAAVLERAFAVVSGSRRAPRRVRRCRTALHAGSRSIQTCCVERSRLEQIVMHALSGDKLRLDGSDYTPDQHARLVADRVSHEMLMGNAG